MAICGIASITVTATTIALWLRHRIKDNIKQCRDMSLLVQQKSVQLCVALESLQITGLLHLWNEALICILVFSLARPILYVCTAFLHQSSSFFSLKWGIFWLCCCHLFSATVCSWGLSLNISDHQVRVTCAGEGRCPGCAAATWYAREWLCLLRHFPRLWLVVLTHRQWPASYSTVRS